MGRKLRACSYVYGTLTLLICCLTAPTSWAGGLGFSISPAPAWVVPALAFDPDIKPVGQSRAGYFSRLQDFQYNGIEIGHSSFYKAVEYVLIDKYGIDNFSNVEISFDDNYEQLNLHELLVLRDGKQIDKLRSTILKILPYAGSSTEVAYDGTRTLAIVLDDVQVGDTIRYAYSITGENPIFQGKRELRLNTQTWSELGRQYTRILTSADKPLNRRVRGADVPLVVNEQDGVQEIVLDQRNLSRYISEEGVPNWRNNRGTLVFSDMNDWRSVVDWALPMYQLSEVPSAKVVTIASVIRAAHSDPHEQAGAALRWVQAQIENVRVGLVGNSHWPARPADTLVLGYGDSKDKALLLIALLEELQIKADAALVNTRRALDAGTYPYRLHAFDHVVVHVLMDGESHYLDPTRHPQAGALGERFEPNYGRALLVRADVNGLSEMNGARSTFALSVNRAFTLPVQKNSAGSGREKTSGYAEFTVDTQMQGRLAERVRYSWETDSEAVIREAYLDQYRNDFPSIILRGLPVVANESGNGLRVIEEYAVDGFWTSELVGSYERWLYADGITRFLNIPKIVENRTLPFELEHPVDINETWVVSSAEKVMKEELNGQVDTPWFTFSKISTLVEGESALQVQFRYLSLRNEVEAEDLAEYAAAVARVRKLASLYLVKEPIIGAAAESEAELADVGAWGAYPVMSLVLLLLFRKRSAS